MASISLSGVSKSFGPIHALRDMNVEVEDGEFFVILGPSGAGKTTLLRTVAGLERPDDGRVSIGGQDVTALSPANRDCAFVFQQYSLYPHLTVFENIAFPLRSPMRRHAEDDILQRVDQVARMLHIESKLQRKATALSGGEMQRVAIGRALVRRPKVFLMDEPLSSLDAKLREELRVELRRIQRGTGSTVIYVTHDQVEATTMADRIAIIEEGRIRQVGTPQQVYTDPGNLAAAQRLGSPVVNVLPADWFQGHASPRVAHVAIRPEDVEVDLEVESNGFRVIESSLVKHLVVAERAGVEVRAKFSSDHPLPIGRRIALKFPLNRCFYFDDAGDRVATS